MTVKERLEKLRQRFPECQLAVFADVSTRMVLASSAGARATQEKFETLCNHAADVLKADDTIHVAGNFGADATVAGWFTIVVRPDERLCFVRSPVAPEEAMCMQTGAGAPVLPLINAARTLLSEIGAEA